LLAALRQAAPALPVVVITADVARSPDTDAARRQADAFLRKPVPPARLIEVASALIDNAPGLQWPKLHPQ
jgi:CheY-like chemotaxis protein